MKRKGITPVIAVVLLLLITVGAVASAWGLYQQLAGQGQDNVQQLEARQKASNTGLTYRSVYEDSDDQSIKINIANTGSRAVNLSQEVSLYAIPEGEQSALPWDVIRDDSGYSQFWAAGDTTDTECFQMGSDDLTNGVLNESETYTCDTGFKFPKPTSQLTVQINYDDVSGFTWEHTCSPQSSGSTTC
ncbi:MAG: hypothetical protein H8Z69_00410 [Nanohaloarchaea archaeon]|nr:hypothetical protein [Candidatus Nanohaloarchaea archaeon]